MVSMKQRPKPTNHPLEAGRVSTMAEIFSVTVPKVCPGSMTGARSIASDLYCSGMLCIGAKARYSGIDLHGAAFSCTLSKHHPCNSGLGFLTSAKYVVRGRVFNSPSKL